MRPLDILEKVHEKNPKVHLYFMGWSVQEEELKDQIQLRGLGEFAHLLGYSENPFPVIEQCDEVCPLLKSEEFPMCLLESVALNKLFIATTLEGQKTCQTIKHVDEL